MKKENISLVRRQLDKRISEGLKVAEVLKEPKVGWLRVIREALGMSVSQLSKRLGVTPAGVLKYESSEKSGTITLASLKKVANQFDCDVVYFLKPREGTLSKTVEKQAFEYAKTLEKQVSHSMALEDQSISEEERKIQLKEFCEELISSNNSIIWEKK